MPSTIQTYNGTGDPEDHLKTFTMAAKPKSIDSFKDLRKKFLAYYLQQKRYTKDPVELHPVKQKERESTKAFMERFTSESLMFKGAPELMRISGFLHGITYPGLIRRLNDNIPKTVDEMMNITKAFIIGEKAAVNKSKRRGQPWKQQDFHKPHQEQNFD
ncbi:reverse transcriptase domain-containing protein [Tanacetum coccineum]